MENKKKYWIWFSLIKGLGLKRKKQLLEIYKSPKEIYNLSEKELLKISGLGKKTVDNILDVETKKVVDKHIEYMCKNNIDIISIVDKEYPDNLREIYDVPISLYVKGNKEILNSEAIAIVGCRDASDYGKKAAKYFGYNLAKKGINIISGLARGVDSYSHIGNIYALLEENYSHVDNLCTCGKPIAVVGSGLDIIYPAENKKLEEKILSLGGCIISEYPLGTRPQKMHFPARNRIISGISNRCSCYRS